LLVIGFELREMTAFKFLFPLMESRLGRERIPPKT
jgi:hypothetical protein